MTTPLAGLSFRRKTSNLAAKVEALKESQTGVHKMASSEARAARARRGHAAAP